jgi:hypothetical protein
MGTSPHAKKTTPKKATAAHKFPEPDLRQKKDGITLQDQIEWHDFLKGVAKRQAERTGVKRPPSYFEVRKNMEEYYAKRDAQKGAQAAAVTGGKRTRPAKPKKATSRTTPRRVRTTKL